MSYLTIAYVLLNVEIGAEKEVLKDLESISEVTESNTVYGVYDIITKTEASTLEELKDIISHKIRRINKVRSTLTMIVVE
jgi:DNA-binding Lrp family transcriptional regulator